MDSRWLSFIPMVLAVMAIVQSPVPRAAASPLSTTFTYQGQLQTSGSPTTGTCDFQFNLWDAVGSGTPPVGGGQVGVTQTALGLPVSGGLFTVGLDFGPGVFNGDARWLQIAVRCPPGSGAYTTLAPRQALTAAPYALYAPTAPWSGLSGVPAGFADGVDNNTTYTAGAGLTLTGTIFSISTAGASNGQALMFNAGNLVWTNPATTLALPFSATGSTLVGAAFRVTNSSTADNVSTISGTLSAADAGDSVAVAGYYRGTGYAGAGVYGYHAGSGNGVRGESSNGTGVSGASDSGTGVYGQSGAGGYAGYFDGRAHFSQNVGVGVAPPTARLHVSSPSTAAVDDETLRLEAPNKGPNKSHAHWGTAGDWYIRSAAGTGKIILQDSGGNVGVGTDNPMHRLDVQHSGSTIAVHATNFGTGSAGSFETFGSASDSALYVSGWSDSNAAATIVGHGAIALDVLGTARVGVLQITGGSDLSEGFEVDGNDVRPGMVVAIDPQRPGRLRPAAEAYDRKVAGIVSGAGGIRPGMMMGQSGSLAAGKYPVALSGRVYCLADASTDAITPGDLLTTSATSGHAMKVTDHDRAHGAIIGKAMTGLERGRTGMVLALVTLE